MNFLTNLISGLSLGSVYAIIALGYTMVYGISKMLNFAHGDIIMIGGYMSFIMSMYVGMNGWLAQGCPKESGKFLDFAAENIPATGKSTDSAELSMIAMILNETVNASIESGMKNILADAIQDTLGLSKSPADYYKEFGAETIFAELDRLSSAYGCGTYVHKDKAAWDKILG